MFERKYLALSIKHTAYGWKYGRPCVLWGSRTEDEEPRSFSGYTEYPAAAELYSLADWELHDSFEVVKLDEPVKVTSDLCQKWHKYDTVLVEYEAYLNYCRFFSLRLAPEMAACI